MVGAGRKSVADLNFSSFARCLDPLSAMYIRKPSVGYGVGIHDFDLVCKVNDGSRKGGTGFGNRRFRWLDGCLWRWSPLE